MARLNPISDQDRQIGQRLRDFRTKKTGLSVVEFARRIGIDSNRLSSYEHGRVPIRYEVADNAAKQFGICQRWLAEGKEPQIYYIWIERQLAERIQKNASFSSVYNTILSPHVEKHLSDLLEFWGGESSPIGLDIIQEVGRNSVGGIGAMDLLNHLFRNLVESAGVMPPDLYQEFYRKILTASRGFERSNTDRIDAWRKAAKAAPIPEWVQIAKQELTGKSKLRNNADVKLTLKGLMDKVRKLTEPAGMKTKLAADLKVPTSRVSEWLSGKHDPSGEVTLQLLHWVHQQEQVK